MTSNYLPLWLRIRKPTALAHASNQLAETQLELLEARRAQEAWDAEVAKLTKRETRLKKTVSDLAEQVTKERASEPPGP